MNCEKCNKNEVTYDSPGKWCDHCWELWWFEGYSESEKIEAKPFLFVCRAFKDLGDNATDAQVKKQVMTNSRGSVNPQAVDEAIDKYRKFELDEIR